MGTDADMWDARYSAPDLAWGTDPNRRLVAEVSALPPGRALDLGAGEGRNAVWLASRGWAVTAVDFSRAGLERAAAMADDAGVQLELTVADVTTYEPAGAAYDLVILMFLQLPNPPLDDVVERAARAVAPGGTFLLIAHDRTNLEHGYGGPQNPAMLIRVDDVVAHLEGFDIALAEPFERVVSTDAGEHTAIDCIVRATRPRSTTSV